MQCGKLLPPDGRPLPAQDQQRGNVAPNVTQENGVNQHVKRRKDTLHARGRRVDVAVTNLHGDVKKATLSGSRLTAPPFARIREYSERIVEVV